MVPFTDISQSTVDRRMNVLPHTPLAHPRARMLEVSRRSRPRHVTVVSAKSDSSVLMSRLLPIHLVETSSSTAGIGN
jgi:hypothetical protein